MAFKTNLFQQNELYNRNGIQLQNESLAIHTFKSDEKKIQMDDLNTIHLASVFS
jgi:hypothetical protein